jgi:hypothetical protein
MARTVWEWKYEVSADGTRYEAYRLWDERVARGGAMEPGDRVTFEFKGDPWEGVVYGNDGGDVRVMFSNGFTIQNNAWVGTFVQMAESELTFHERPWEKPAVYGWGDDTPWNEGEGES